MNEWHSKRFGKSVALTRHAVDRIRYRGISVMEVQTLVEAGEIKWKGDHHLWIFHPLPDRKDNLVCATAVEENVLVVKTLMSHWEEDET